MPRPVSIIDLVKINVAVGTLEEIKKYIENDKQYRNPTEFVNECVRIRLFELRKAKIDQGKLDAFYLREDQIKTKNANAFHSHNPPS